MTARYIKTIREIIGTVSKPEMDAVFKALYLTENSNDQFLYRYGLVQDPLAHQYEDVFVEKIEVYRQMFRDLGADHPTARAVLYNQGHKNQDIFSENTIAMLDRAGREYLEENTLRKPRYDD